MHTRCRGWSRITASRPTSRRPTSTRPLPAFHPLSRVLRGYHPGPFQIFMGPDPAAHRHAGTGTRCRGWRGIMASRSARASSDMARTTPTGGVAKENDGTFDGTFPNLQISKSIYSIGYTLLLCSGRRHQAPGSPCLFCKQGLFRGQFRWRSTKSFHALQALFVAG